MNPSTFSIGIDLSLKKNQVVAVDPQGTQLACFTVDNDLPGATFLVEKIAALATTHHATHLRIGMEATNMYWWHLHQFLVQSEILNKDFSVDVFTLNPKLIKKFHDAQEDWDKTDVLDALVIAEKVRTGRLKTSHLIDEQYEPLKRLTRFRYHLIKSIIVEKNYFLTYLFLKYSSWQKVAPFSSPYGVTAQDFISEFDPETLAAISLDDIVSRIIKASRNTIADPQKTAKLLAHISKTSYQLNKKFKEPVDLILMNIYDNIRYFDDKVKKLDVVIEKEFQRLPNPLTSINGIGRVFAAGITGELGTVSLFPRQSAIGKYAGLAWKKSQSADFDAQETPRKPGNPYLRYYLVQAANSLRVHDELYRQYYEKKVKEVPKHQHKRALVLTARKLARLCFAMLRDQRFYQPSYQKGDSP